MGWVDIDKGRKEKLITFGPKLKFYKCKYCESMRDVIH